MKLLVLFYSELIRFINMIKRYFFNFLTSTLIMTFIFFLIFFGLKGFMSNQINQESLNSLILGYILWLMAISSFQGVATTIWEESQKGTLEKLYLSSLGIKKIFLTRVLVQIIYNLFISLLVLFIVMLITGHWLKINYLYAIPMILNSMLPLIGIGFFAGGLALIFKKVMALFQIFSFGLAGLLTLNIYPLNIFSFLPYISNAKTLIGSVVYSKHYPLWWYGFLLINSFVYLFIGLFLFNNLDKKARRMNKLAQY